ncbi:hypothetical protein BJ508DRAFT_349502 [Ascobolus immersus RN42]|uniref:Uncharacterized protein n=1 Tax=Ascobolus immersus RN42 TaxID=1160509 RepID=A0A3N4I2F0_ASCIM|nr:hypothetical protein BJ508DRAFT_349502 [Ascobolus immersus RN42]
MTDLQVPEDFPFQTEPRFNYLEYRLYQFEQFRKLQKQSGTHEYREFEFRKAQTKLIELVNAEESFRKLRSIESEVIREMKELEKNLYWELIFNPSLRKHLEGLIRGRLEEGRKRKTDEISRLERELAKDVHWLFLTRWESQHLVQSSSRINVHLESQQNTKRHRRTWTALVLLSKEIPADVERHLADLGRKLALASTAEELEAWEASEERRYQNSDDADKLRITIFRKRAKGQKRIFYEPLKLFRMVTTLLLYGADKVNLDYNRRYLKAKKAFISFALQDIKFQEAPTLRKQMQKTKGQMYIPTEWDACADIEKAVESDYKGNLAELRKREEKVEETLLRLEETKMEEGWIDTLSRWFAGWNM